ncbi:MAG: phosphate signaling complex protein PhoU [Spirochaetia bacterium]|jgi:phosphate transport system protein
MTTRHHYHEKLEQLKIEVLKMGGMIDESISRAMHALVKNNKEVGGKVVEDENKINHMEYEIEDRCVFLLATEQPVAGELRFIISTLKAVRDLERCGDYACHIANTALQLSENTTVTIHEDLPKMAETCREMLRQVMQAYTDEDEELAAKVRTQDNIVDSLYLHSFKEMLSDMRQDPDHVRQVNSLLFVSKCLERLADHIINICEEVEYMCTGSRRET